jgi:hypothetical protein
MKMKNLRPWSIALAALLVAAAAAAQEPLSITGFVDASAFGDANSETATFGLDQAELDVETVLGERGFVRADLEWVKSGDGWEPAVEQGYLGYRPAFADRVTFTFGRFNAPMGFELLDPNEMFQFSHGLVFDYGIPSNLTGLMAAGDLGRGFDLAAWWVDGWDNNDTKGGKPKTVGGRLGRDLRDLGGVGVSFITGKELADPETSNDTEVRRTVVDADLTLTPAEKLVVGAELNWGEVQPDDAEDKAGWLALLVMAHRDINEWFGITARVDWLDDQDGAVFESGDAETRMAFTLAPTFVLGDGMGALVEIRLDTSDREVWVDADGKPTDSALTGAFEMTYSF